MKGVVSDQAALIPPLQCGNDALSLCLRQARFPPLLSNKGWLSSRGELGCCRDGQMMLNGIEI